MDHAVEGGCIEHLATEDKENTCAGCIVGNYTHEADELHLGSKGCIEHFNNQVCTPPKKISYSKSAFGTLVR